jgi:hypothetical protein
VSAPCFGGSYGGDNGKIASATSGCTSRLPAPIAFIIRSEAPDVMALSDRLVQSLSRRDLLRGRLLQEREP